MSLHPSERISWRSVVPFVKEHRTVSEIVEETGFTKGKVRGAIASARRHDLSLRPSVEEKKAQMSRAYMGIAPAIKGTVFQAPTIEKLTKKRRGRELSEGDKEFIALTVQARGLIKKSGEPSLDEAFERLGLQATHRGKGKAVLEIIYAATISDAEGYQDGIRKGDADKICSRLSPRQKKALAEKITIAKEGLIARKTLLLKEAEQIFACYKRPPFELFLQRFGIEVPQNPKDAEFLKLLYASRVSAVEAPSNKPKEEGLSHPRIDAKEISDLYDILDPDIFERLGKQITLIREKIQIPTNGTVFSLGDYYVERFNRVSQFASFAFQKDR